MTQANLQVTKDSEGAKLPSTTELSASTTNAQLLDLRRKYFGRKASEIASGLTGKTLPFGTIGNAEHVDIKIGRLVDYQKGTATLDESVRSFMIALEAVPTTAKGRPLQSGILFVEGRYDDKNKLAAIDIKFNPKGKYGSDYANAPSDAKVFVDPVRATYETLLENAPRRRKQ
jgi:hypothetical protein